MNTQEQEPQTEENSPSALKRRDVIKVVGAGLLVGSAAACGKNAGSDGAPGIQTSKSKTFKWKMVTTWPKDYPGLGTGANYLARMISEMSDGRLTIKVYGAGERVPALEVFDAVSRGASEMGHCAAYYWKGKSAATPFFTSVPFGLTAQEQNGWLHHGGGMALWRELYDGFNLVPFEAGNTGTQMGGWYNREINGLDDLKGLKMRIPGLGGEVMERLGVSTQNIPGGELFTAMQTGVIDATEWVGPYNDLAFGFHKVAKYYYYPGWQEPGPTLEAIINKDKWQELPADLQQIVRIACQATGSQMASEFVARNSQALSTLVNEHGITPRPYPRSVINALRKVSDEVLRDLVAEDPFAKKVYASFDAYRQAAIAMTAITDQAYLDTRKTP